MSSTNQTDFVDQPLRSQTQMLFDRVATHLLRQGARSKSRGVCRYRAGELRCAVGCLIDDLHYWEYVEGYSIEDSSTARNAVEGSLGVELSNDDVALLANLQGVHDVSPIEDWSSELRRSARRFKLSPAVVDAWERAS